MANAIVAGILVLVVARACVYIYKRKKSGAACGCSGCGTCNGKCGR